jgi:hypothetical protein
MASGLSVARFEVVMPCLNELSLVAAHNAGEPVNFRA